MARDEGQFGRQLGTSFDAVIVQLSVKDVQCAKSNLVQVDRLRFEINAFEQGAEAL